MRLEQIEALANAPLLSGTNQSPLTVFPWRNSLVVVREAPPETAWLLEGVIPDQSVVLLSGREGSMKSWLALDWAAAIAEGKPWQGCEAEAGAVCYIDAEMPGRLFHARLFAAGPSQNLNIMRWQDEGFPTKLDHPAIVQAAQHHRLLVIDTLRRFMEGLDENSSTDMAIITGKLRRLTQWGASVLALHHGIKDTERGGYRGSTELGAGVDICLDLVKKKDSDGEDQLILAASKTRYSNDPGLILRVEKTQARPIFHDITGAIREAKAQAKEGDVRRLRDIISDLSSQNGTRPNQTDIVNAAAKAKLGSRATVLSWLREGEGEHWRSESTGRTRVYSLQTCLIHPNRGGVDRLDRSENLSTCIEDSRKNKLDRLSVEVDLDD